MYLVFALLFAANAQTDPTKKPTAAQPDPICNAVLLGEGLLEPMGDCLQLYYLDESERFECAEDGTLTMKLYEGVTDCSGDPTHTYTDWCADLDHHCKVYCSNSNDAECALGTVTIYMDDYCFEREETFSFVLDYCAEDQGSYHKYVCGEEGAITSEIYTSKDCSGFPVSSYTLVSDHCHDGVTAACSYTPPVVIEVSTAAGGISTLIALAVSAMIGFYICLCMRHNKLFCCKKKAAKDSTDSTTVDTGNAIDGKTRDATIYGTAETEPKERDVEPDWINEIQIRKLECDKSITTQINENEDYVQLLLAHGIQCCENQSGLDIYQVLAFRSRDMQSHIMNSLFKVKGYELPSLSPYHKTFCVAFICGVLQTVGITVVVYKLLNAYFGDGVHAQLCNLDLGRWSDVYSLKVLAFMWSLVITFSITGALNGIGHNGLYEIATNLDVVTNDPVSNSSTLGKVLSLSSLFSGQIINYYAIFFAIIGSFFIIFISNQGSEITDKSGEVIGIDYSSAGLEMILNGVALFFMLELDDWMVSEEDYLDCEKYLRTALRDYSLQKKAIESESDALQSLCRFVPVKHFHFGIYVISWFVSVSSGICGLVAPFVIFICW